MFRNVLKFSIFVRFDLYNPKQHLKNEFRILTRCLSTNDISKQSLIGKNKVINLELSTTSSNSSSTSSSDEEDDQYDEVTVQYVRGVPQVIVPLPSRKEKCKFILKPLSNTVGDFLKMLRDEDKGIDQLNFYTIENLRIASSNTIESLLENNFKLRINDVTYFVFVPKVQKLSNDEIEKLSDVRSLVNQLYESLNVHEYHVQREHSLRLKLETLKQDLEPLEQTKQVIYDSANKKTNFLAWAGLGLMSMQFGILARLTWWEYSWDIMEPITYFVTYGTAIACYAYFVVTKEEYVLPQVRNRQHLIAVQKKARKTGLDINKYNQLKDEISILENELKNLQNRFPSSTLSCEIFNKNMTSNKKTD